MNKTIAALVAGLLGGGAAGWFLARHQTEPAAAVKPAAEAAHKKEAHETPGAHGESVVKLDKEKQQAAGLRTDTPPGAELAPEVKAYGRALDPAPLAALWAEIGYARAALESSAKEAARSKTLFAQNQNTSARALELSEAAWKRDQILLEAAQSRLISTWSKPLADRANLPVLIQSLTALRAVVVRVDVPLSDSIRAAPTAARVSALSGETPPQPADVLGSAPSADLQAQGQGFLLLLKSDSMPPGTALSAYLSLPGPTQHGVVLPRSALVRKDGDAFIYVQTGEDLFERRKVELTRPLPAGWFVSEGVSPQDRLVIVGAQQLLSEELKSEGGEE